MLIFMHAYIQISRKEQLLNNYYYSGYFQVEQVEFALSNEILSLIIKEHLG